MPLLIVDIAFDRRIDVIEAAAAAVRPECCEFDHDSLCPLKGLLVTGMVVANKNGNCVPVVADEFDMPASVPCAMPVFVKSTLLYLPVWLAGKRPAWLNK